MRAGEWVELAGKHDQGFLHILTAQDSQEWCGWNWFKILSWCLMEMMWRIGMMHWWVVPSGCHKAECWHFFFSPTIHSTHHNLHTPHTTRRQHWRLKLYTITREHIVHLSAAPHFNEKSWECALRRFLICQQERLSKAWLMPDKTKRPPSLKRIAAIISKEIQTEFFLQALINQNELAKLRHFGQNMGNLTRVW